MEGNGQFGYRLLWAVDVEKYSLRDARAQLLAQMELSEVLTAAAMGAGLDRDDWIKEARGDGELAILPAHVDIPHAVGAFSCQMEAALAELNAGRQLRDRLRLRLAMHYGTLAPGPFGYAGQAPIVASRLLDSKPLRKNLARHPDRDLALAVSATLYRDVIMTGFCPLDPADFTAFRIAPKGTTYQGYLYQMTDRAQPRLVGHPWPTKVPEAGSGEISDPREQDAVVLFLNRSAQ